MIPQVIDLLDESLVKFHFNKNFNFHWFAKFTVIYWRPNGFLFVAVIIRRRLNHANAVITTTSFIFRKNDDDDVNNGDLASTINAPLKLVQILCF